MSTDYTNSELKTIREQTGLSFVITDRKQVDDAIIENEILNKKLRDEILEKIKPFESEDELLEYAETNVLKHIRSVYDYYYNCVDNAIIITVYDNLENNQKIIDSLQNLKFKFIVKTIPVCTT
jgi:hypothetical protein